VRFLEEGMAFYDSTVSVSGGGNVSVDADWVPLFEGERNISVVVDPLNRVIEKEEGNNRADKGFYVITTVPGYSTTSIRTTTSLYPPAPGDMTTTTLTDSCVLPGNAPPCNEVTLAEVVSGITAWSNGSMQLNDVIALINSWADQSGYPPA
jgi:hypothetical protein